MDILEHTTGLVPGPGLYRMPAALYHSDPCPDGRAAVGGIVD